MLHELAHIVHSKHTAAFYELMDALREQWEQLEACGQVLDEKGFPTIGGHRIDSTSHNPTVLEARKRAVAAAEKRQNLNQMMSSGKLGYGNEPLSWRNLPPRERAARAAERRAREAMLGFGEDELPLALSSSPVDSNPPQDMQRLQKKRRLCGRSGCQCGECAFQSKAGETNTDALAAEDERLLQLAISRSLECLESSLQDVPVSMQASVAFPGLHPHNACIVLSDDETEANQKKKCSPKMVIETHGILWSLFFQNFVAYF